MIAWYNISKRKGGNKGGESRLLTSLAGPTSHTHKTREQRQPGCLEEQKLLEFEGKYSVAVTKGHKIQGDLIATQMDAKKTIQVCHVISLSEPQVQIWPDKIHRAMKMLRLYQETMATLLVVTCICFSCVGLFVYAFWDEINKNSSLQSWFLYLLSRVGHSVSEHIWVHPLPPAPSSKNCFSLQWCHFQLCRVDPSSLYSISSISILLSSGKVPEGFPAGTPPGHKTAPCPL